MIIRMILLGVLGAFLVTALDWRSTSIMFGVFFGVAISEYLRIRKSVQQLQQQVESLQGHAQSRGSAAATPTKTASKRRRIEPISSEPVTAHALQASTPATSARPEHTVSTASSASDSSAAAHSVKVAPRRIRPKKPPNALQTLIGRTSMPTRVGVVVLFFGVSFLLRYAAERGVFPVEARLFLVIVLGAVIYQVGRKLQQKERGYGLLLRGGGIGIWYLSCYAAASLYHLIGASTAFAILAGLSGFTAYSAVRHDTKAMAFLGVVGGFLTPILLSTGEGSHVALFSYYTVINAGILAIAYRKTWAELPIAGFVFTFGIGAFWGASSYQPEYFNTTEPFLLLSAIIYLCVPLLFANQARNGKTPIYNNVIVFGAPAIAFTLQLQLVSEFGYGDAWSAFGFAGVYALTLAMLWAWLGKIAPALRDAFIAIATVFFTLGIAFVFDQDVTGAIWALEAVGGVWLASRQQRAWGCYLSLLILWGAGILWVLDMPSAGERFLFNSAFLQMAIIGLAGFAIAFILDKRPGLLKGSVPAFAVGWASAWWLAGGGWQVSHHFVTVDRLPVFGLYVLCTSAALLALYTAIAWLRAGHLTSFAMLLTGVLGLVASFRSGGPLNGLGTFVWPLVVIYFYATIYKLSATPSMSAVCRAGYVFVVALIVAIGGAELHVLSHHYLRSSAGSVIAISLTPLILFWLIQRGRLWRLSFMNFHQDTICSILAIVLTVCFYLGLMVPPDTVSATGKLSTWPLSLMQCALLVSIAIWWIDQRSTLFQDLPRNKGWIFIGASAFLLVNTLLLRFIHISQNIPYELDDLWANNTVQTTLSLFWTLCGVATVMLSSRHKKYLLWNTGMALLFIVVAKLFLIDLAQSGTIERIVSFMAVGLLLMTVGWKSPRPDRPGTEKQPTPNEAT